ncbi:hypothetical protein ACLF3G_23010 [Falsiroseomonas sp. HC035]|uniref:hypothetical protein n=1 Tax=Falsiroseomonas sp. HC035 TaxID=3390999 RepID=UPI003D313C36
MSATTALPEPDSHDPLRAGPEARRFGLALGAATLAALAAATLLPPPAAPPPARSIDLLRPAEDRLAASLERLAAANPTDAGSLRRLVDQLRASHRPLQLAIALERLHGMTGEPEPLREAMQLRAELGDAAAARAALERLSATGAATEQEALRLAALRIEAGDAAGAFAGLLAATSRSPTPELALRAMQAAARLPDPSLAMRPLGGLLAEVAPDLAEALRRVLMGDGRPDLALYLLEGLPAEDQSRPATGLLLAQAEARAGWAGAALARLMALRATEGLPPGGGALLVELALREGQLEEAFAVAALLPPDAWPADLPMRLHEAARSQNRDSTQGREAAGQPGLFRQIDPQRLAARPDAAAVVALARGDRVAARRFAQAALELPPESVEGARGVAAVLRELGQDQAAHDRLRRVVQGDSPDPASIRLFAELAALPERRAAALPLLERWRGQGPVTGEAWLRLALAEGRLADAAMFLRGGGTASPTALAGTLSMAAQQRDPALAEAAAAALRAAPTLPEGWTTEEVAVAAALSRPLNATTLSAALNLLAWAAEATARDRVVLLLASAPEAGAAAAQLSAAQHPAIPRLKREAGAPGEAGTARLALLAVLAPEDAAPLLAVRADTEPARFGAALVLARLRAEGMGAGVATLRGLLPKLSRSQQEQVLFLALASAPQAMQPALRGVAEETLGAGWRRRYESVLTRQGRRAELVAALRARAALADLVEREEIAVRLDQLGDAAGAAAIRRGEDEEAP